MVVASPLSPPCSSKNCCNCVCDHERRDKASQSAVDIPGKYCVCTLTKILQETWYNNMQCCIASFTQCGNAELACLTLVHIANNDMASSMHTIISWHIIYDKRMKVVNRASIGCKN